MSTACYLGKLVRMVLFSHTDITDHRKQNLNATKLLSYLSLRNKKIKDRLMINKIIASKSSKCSYILLNQSNYIIYTCEIMKLSHQFQVSHRPFLTAVTTPVLND